MAVYTHISDTDLENMLSGYTIGTAQSCEAIATGINNSNYALKTDQGRYILTIVEDFSPGQEALPYITALMKHLHGHGVPCPRVLPDRNGKFIQMRQGKPALILSFLKGREASPITAEHCAALGHMLAKMHKASQSFTQKRNNPWSVPKLLQDKTNHLQHAAEFDAALPAILEQHFENLSQNWPTDLPQGGIHADLFPDNALFDGTTLTGIIDFYLSAQDILAYDLAICINAWCFDAAVLNVEKATALITAYQKEHALTKNEITQLQILHQGAALRFLLSRLAEWINRPKDALVTPHNPQDYIDRLHYHTTHDIREIIT